MNLGEVVIVFACGVLIVVTVGILSLYEENQDLREQLYPSGQMGSCLTDVSISPHYNYYGEPDYDEGFTVRFEYHGGGYTFTKSDVPLEKIQNMNWTSYRVQKGNETYIRTNSWSWEWHTEDETYYADDYQTRRVRVLDALYCNGYGENKLEVEE